MRHRLRRQRMATTAADAVGHTRMGQGQMRPHKSRKALAAAAVVVVRVTPCKPVARNRTVSRTVQRMAATSGTAKRSRERLRRKELRGKRLGFFAPRNASQ